MCHGSVWQKCIPRNLTAAADHRMMVSFFLNVCGEAGLNTRTHICFPFLLVLPHCPLHIDHHARMHTPVLCAFSFSLSIIFLFFSASLLPPSLPLSPSLSLSSYLPLPLLLSQCSLFAKSLVTSQICYTQQSVKLPTTPGLNHQQGVVDKHKWPSILHLNGITKCNFEKVIENAQHYKESLLTLT